MVHIKLFLEKCLLNVPTLFQSKLYHLLNRNAKSTKRLFLLCISEQVLKMYIIRPQR